MSPGNKETDGWAAAAAPQWCITQFQALSLPIRLKSQHKRPQKSWQHPDNSNVPLRDHQILSSGFLISEMKPQSAAAPWKGASLSRASAPSRRERQSYRGVLRFRTPSSARSSHNSGPRRRCLRPRCFLWGEDRRERASETSTTGAIKKKPPTSHTLFSLSLHWRWTMETQNMRHCYHPSTERKEA